MTTDQRHVANPFDESCLQGAGNRIQAEGAVALAAALKGNTTLQTLVLSCMSTSAVCGPLARVHSAGNARPHPGDLASVRAERRERMVVVVGVACASAGSAHSLLRGAGNDIEDEGAVALAAALHGNTTLQTLKLYCMWTARTRAFCGKCAAAPGGPRECTGGEGASGWWVWSARRARVWASAHGVVRGVRQGREEHRDHFERR
jgi:hypothetical protein